jgi:hypothetical protein
MQVNVNIISILRPRFFTWGYCLPSFACLDGILSLFLFCVQLDSLLLFQRRTHAQTVHRQNWEEYPATFDPYFLLSLSEEILSTIYDKSGTKGEKP